MKSITTITVLFIFLALATAGHCRLYMKVQGISGSSFSAAHRNCCVVEGFTLWPRVPVSAAFLSGASEHAQNQMNNLAKVKKQFDKASPLLAQKAANNGHIPQLTIHVTTKYGGQERTVITYQFKSVRLTGMAVSAAGDQPMPLEELEFRYQNVKVVYTPLNAHGKAGKAISASWSAGGGGHQEPHHEPHQEPHHEPHQEPHQESHHESHHGEHHHGKPGAHEEERRREMMERMRRGQGR